MQHSKKLTAQLSFPLAALPCCVTSKRGGAQGGMVSSHEASRHEGEGEGEREERRVRMGTGEIAARPGWIKVNERTKGGRVHERQEEE